MVRKIKLDFFHIEDKTVCYKVIEKYKENKDAYLKKVGGPLIFMAPCRFVSVYEDDIYVYPNRNYNVWEYIEYVKANLGKDDNGFEKPTFSWDDRNVFFRFSRKDYLLGIRDLINYASSTDKRRKALFLKNLKIHKNLIAGDILHASGLFSTIFKTFKSPVRVVFVDSDIDKLLLLRYLLSIHFYYDTQVEFFGPFVMNSEEPSYPPDIVNYVYKRFRDAAKLDR